MAECQPLTGLAIVVMVMMMAVTVMILSRSRRERTGNGQQGNKGEDATGELFHENS